MEDQLISFETAKLAKEKGFNILCYYYYDINGKLYEPYLENGSSSDVDFKVSLTELLEDRNCKYDNTISAPTQSLLQKWLRETHNIHISITLVDYEGYYYCEIVFKKTLLKINIINKTYEEILELGLYEALKLI